jgi:rhodanese-related sulfurtransferase
MTAKSWRPLATFVLLATLAACSGSSEQAGTTDTAPEISGRLEAGLRVLTLDAGAKDQHLTIYRGDYVRAELSTGEPFTLEIPALEVAMRFPVAEGERPYFKVPDAGSFPFTAGEAGGTIEAVEYRSAGYREVTAQEAAGLIPNLDPLILDVRTEREFAGGHLENAVLIPVQVFRQRLGELADHKQRPVLVYCRTGNRSTVAAKLLVDAGFEQVINIRRGIVEWERAGLPTTR